MKGQKVQHPTEQWQGRQCILHFTEAMAPRLYANIAMTLHGPGICIQAFACHLNRVQISL